VKPSCGERRDPSAALESAAAVPVRRADCLQNAVDGGKRGGSELPDRSSLLVGREV
jgi:hypothetical protein